MTDRLTDVRESTKPCCESCGRPLDLWCEDCGCPVSCHDVIDLKNTGRVPYCMWDFGPCLKEQRPVFLAAIDVWLCETIGRHTE